MESSKINEKVIFTPTQKARNHFTVVDAVFVFLIQRASTWAGWREEDEAHKLKFTFLLREN
jgi:hypothetical protein